MTEIDLEYLAEDKGKQERGPFKIKFSKKVTQHSKKKHNENVERTIVEAIRTDEAEK